MSGLAFQEQLGRLTAPRPAASGTPLRAGRNTSPKSFCHCLQSPYPPLTSPSSQHPLAVPWEQGLNKAVFLEGHHLPNPSAASLHHKTCVCTARRLGQGQEGSRLQGPGCASCFLFPSLLGLADLKASALPSPDVAAQKFTVPRLSRNPSQVSPPVTL